MKQELNWLIDKALKGLLGTYKGLKLGWKGIQDAKGRGLLGTYKGLKRLCDLYKADRGFEFIRYL